MNNTIIYEQPLNEVIRVCLRLEYLFQQLEHQLKDTSLMGTRNVICSIIHLLQLLDRPDLKAKLSKELVSLHSNLMRFGNMPDIDAVKLQTLTQQLEELSRKLIDSNGKIGQRLRDIELLNNLRLQLANPAGGLSFDIPLNHYWLQQPAEVRQTTINHWLSDFTEIKNTVDLILELFRKNAKLEKKEAIHGFHQELLDPQSNLRMIRIAIEENTPAYPEISVGRHFLSVRFFSPDIEKRPVQFPQNLFFWIAYCNL